MLCAKDVTAHTSKAKKSNFEENLHVVESGVRHGAGGDTEGKDGEAEHIALGRVRVHPVLLGQTDTRVTSLRCVAMATHTSMRGNG